MNYKVLIVDDEVSICSSLSGALSDDGYKTSFVYSGEEALERMEENHFDVVLLDVWLSGMNGIEVLRNIKKTKPDQLVIVMSGHATIETAVKATKLGAYDFIEKPLSLEKLLISMKNSLGHYESNQENKRLKHSLHQHKPIIGNSKKIQELREQMAQVAPQNSWILIRGENGTGKELVAREIYLSSSRKEHAFVEVNCAAIPEDLIESELFGHDQGTFTGATQQKEGKFDLAHKGVLFLDEVADMSLKTQAKILRILEEKKFFRVGGNQIIQVDVRLIAATNKNLEEEIIKGRFREDLYYRLNVIPIYVPTLRERKNDISLLLQHYFAYYRKEFKLSVKPVAKEVFDLLREYHWPGNVRELKNVCERLSIMNKEETIKLSSVPIEIRKSVLSRQTLSKEQEANDRENVIMASTKKQNRKNLKEARTDFERDFILEELDKSSWNISKTAKNLGIERTHLYRKLRNFNIKPINKEP